MDGVDISEIFEKIKENRLFSILTIMGLIALIIMIISTAGGTEKELTAMRDELLSEKAELERLVNDGRTAMNNEKNEVIYKSTGLKPELVSKDTNMAKSFFKDAFTWENGDDYKSARSFYIDELGEGNSFTESYLPEDIEVETKDGMLSYIDHSGTKTHLEEFDIIPLVAEENRVRYIALVEHYMYQDSRDLSNISALEPSSAIVRFTVSGNEGDERIISEVEAYTGVASKLQN